VADIDAVRKVCKLKFIWTLQVLSLFQSYEHLFKVNDKASGGSFYIQSKVREIHLTKPIVNCFFCLTDSKSKRKIRNGNEGR